MDFVEALDIKSLPPGSHTVISISGKEVLLFNIDGEISAIGNICLHKGGLLSEGKVEKKYDGHYVTCPWHGWEYNVKTGAAPPGFVTSKPSMILWSKTIRFLFQRYQECYL
jgi:nitrite reductase/ring-hydroxylating ferredoxin subunit